MIKKLGDKRWVRAVIVVTIPVWFPVALVLGIAVLIIGYLGLGIAGFCQGVYNYIQTGEFQSDILDEV